MGFGNVKYRDKQLKRLEIVALVLVDMIGGDDETRLRNEKKITEIIDKFAYDDNTVSPDQFAQARDSIRIGGRKIYK